MKNSVGYLLREGVRSLWSNRNMALASIAVLMSCLVLLGSALMIVFNINRAVGWMEGQNVILVYLRNGLSEKETAAFGEMLGARDDILECTFISKEEALERQKESLGENGDLFDSYKGENPFPDTYQVSVGDIEEYASISAELAGMDEVEKVSDRREEADTMFSIRKTVGMISFWVIGLLSLVAVFIIANTIRITINSRHLELSIMKSVGATNGFIIIPFMIEGMLIGLISGLLSVGVLWYLYKLASDGVINISLFSSLMPFGEVGWWLLLIFSAAGVALGALGSFISVYFYLRKDRGGIYNVL